MKISRRGFLKKAAAAAGAAAFPAIIPSSALGADGAVAPSNRIALAFIGMGREGRLRNLRSFMAEPDVTVVGLCDVNQRRLTSAHLAMQNYSLDPERSNYDGCFCTQDWRELVDRPEVDAVVISTPDHWHALPAVAAGRAGKDVFLEKPVSLTIHEGRVLSDTMKLYGRVFQVGSEFRTSTPLVRAVELVRNGRIGKIQHIDVCMYGGFGFPNETKSPKYVNVKPPEYFDFNMWLGPAPTAPFHPGLCGGMFRFNYDYGGGNITEWGPHIMDIAQWGNGSDRTGPVQIDGHGEFPTEGIYNVAYKFEIHYTYADGVTLTCKTGGQEMSKYDGTLVRFEGSDGWVHAYCAEVTASSKEILQSVIGPEEMHPRTCRFGERRDFLDCVKSRAETFNPVEVGHRTASLCHLGNISMRLGRKLYWDPQTEQFRDDDEANRMVRRPMRAPWRLEA